MSYLACARRVRGNRAILHRSHLFMGFMSIFRALQLYTSTIDAVFTARIPAVNRRRRVEMSGRKNARCAASGACSSPPVRAHKPVATAVIRQGLSIWGYFKIYSTVNLGNLETMVLGVEW